MGQTVESRLASLSELKTKPEDEATGALRKALGLKTALVVGKAAEVAQEMHLLGLLPDLEAALERFHGASSKKDPGCLARLPLVSACDELGSEREDLFRQPFAAPGTSEGLAELRGRCLQALFRFDPASAVNQAATLLADPLATARLNAVYALQSGYPESVVPLLRYKALVGDEQDGVLDAVFAVLLRMDPSGSLEFVTALFGGRDARLAEVASIALAEHGPPKESLEALVAWAKRLPGERVSVPYVAIATTRSPAAFTFLIDQVANATVTRAESAAEALTPFMDYDEALAARFREALAGREYLEEERDDGYWDAWRVA